MLFCTVQTRIVSTMTGPECKCDRQSKVIFLLPKRVRERLLGLTLPCPFIICYFIGHPWRNVSFDWHSHRISKTSPNKPTKHRIASSCWHCSYTDFLLHWRQTSPKNTAKSKRTSEYIDLLSYTKDKEYIEPKCGIPRFAFLHFLSFWRRCRKAQSCLWHKYELW